MTFISSYSLSEDYAGHLNRIGAFAIDVFIITATLALLAWGGMYLDGENSSVTIPLLNAFQVFMPWFYYAAMESSPKGATIGKIILGSRITDTNGHPTTFARAALRAIPKCLPILWPGYLFALLTRRRQAFHDLVARTVVIRTSE